MAKYHLIFGTRSIRAVQYMNDIVYNALQPYFAPFKDNYLFDMRPGRYDQAPEEEIKNAIIEALRGRPMTRAELYETIIPSYFAQRSTTQYRAMIASLTFDEHRLYPDPRTMKRTNQLNDQTRLATAPWRV